MEKVRTGRKPGGKEDENWHYHSLSYRKHTLGGGKVERSLG
jgi:hypothetical protein